MDIFNYIIQQTNKHLFENFNNTYDHHFLQTYQYDFSDRFTHILPINENICIIMKNINNSHLYAFDIFPIIPSVLEYSMQKKYKKVCNSS